GVLPAVVGSLMAAEALKVLLGIGKPLAGSLVLYDALEGQFRKLSLSRNPACPVCGDHPTQRELIDYEAFCGL
ncbi:MAG: ThiF family adenylyltransferase, partial [Thermus caldifontis]